VDINTHVRNVDGVNKVGMIMQKQLNNLGFTAEVISQVELGNSYFFKNTQEKELDVLLLGNIDNSIRSVNQEYFDMNDQKITGTAVWESKGGLIVMIQALQALRFLRQLRKRKIGILLISDNTIHNQMSRKKIREVSANASKVIGLHGGSLQGSLVSSRPGGAVYRCEMTMKKNLEAHYLSKSVTYFTKAITKLTELSNTSEGLLVIPSSLQMHTNINQMYSSATAKISLRYDDPGFISKFEKQMKSAFALKNRKYLSISFDGGGTRPPMQQNEYTDDFWKKIKQLADELDIRLTKEHRWSSGVTGLVEAGRPVIDGFGPIGTDEHGKSEYILSHSLQERAVLLAMTILKIDC
jgi:D-alanine-D-alanine ligase